MDPLRIANRPDSVPGHMQQTWEFFRSMKNALIDVIPMRTFPKHRYSCGTSLEFLRHREAPERKDWFTLNTPRILNIASQMARQGDFSAEEEKALIQAEKHRMIRPNEAIPDEVATFDKDVAPMLGQINEDFVDPDEDIDLDDDIRLVY